MLENNFVDSIYDGSFDLITESIKNRILGRKVENDQLFDKISQLDSVLANRANCNNNCYEETSNHTTFDNEGYLDYNYDVECPDSFNDESSSEDMSVTFDSRDNDGSVHSNFRKALENFMNTYNTYNSITNNSQILNPPPIPVTSLFRKHNPEASNIFDFHNPSHDDLAKTCDLLTFSTVMDKTLKDSIYTCLVTANDFKKLSKTSPLSEESLYNSLNFGEMETKEYLKLLKVLFSWYFSGYYTGRMELLSQLHNQ